jgi:hypothetical protein
MKRLNWTFFWGIADLVIGIIDMKFDYDTMTYLWLVTGVLFTVVGYVLKEKIIMNPSPDAREGV